MSTRRNLKIGSKVAAAADLPLSITPTNSIVMLTNNTDQTRQSAKHGALTSTNSTSKFILHEKGRSKADGGAYVCTCDPLEGIEGEHPLYEVERGGLHPGELGREGAAGELRQVPHVPPGVLVPDEPQVVVGRGPDDLGDEPHLVHVVSPREERRPVDELHEDAADGPDVDGGGVVGGVEQQLGRPVPPRHHVLRHHVALRRRPREAEVADLEVAVGVQQQVAGLQVPVDHVRRVDVLEPPQQLVQKVLQTHQYIYDPQLVNGNILKSKHTSLDISSVP